MMLRRTPASGPLFALAIFASSARAQTPARHLLDPLDGAEITKAVSVLRQSGHVSDQARFGTITVQQRAKTGTPTRAARILGFDWTKNEAFVAVIDLAAGRVESWAV